MEILCTAEYYASDVCAPYAVPPSCGCRARAIATTINAHLFNNGSIIVHILVSQLLFNLLRFIVFNRMPGIDTLHDAKSAKCIFFRAVCKADHRSMNYERCKNGSEHEKFHHQIK